MPEPRLTDADDDGWTPMQGAPIAGRCWWRGHTWTPWELVTVAVTLAYGRTVDADRNERKCRRCGLTRRNVP